MRTLILFLLLLTWQPAASAQQVFTQDVTNFWVAYDSIRATADPARQLAHLHAYYLDKASEGLRAFVKNKDRVAEQYLALIRERRSYWDRVRPRTLAACRQAGQLPALLGRLRQLYPGLREARTYFIIGLTQQGGTVRSNLSILGTEVLVAGPEARPGELLRTALHEYVHTQQVRPDFQHLHVQVSALREGACDFLAELVTRRPLRTTYASYGRQHEAQVWRVFRQDQHTAANDLRVSTGANPLLPAPDLGYFVGYAICRAYYAQASDKAQAIRDIVELDYTSQAAVQAFVTCSGYEAGLLAHHPEAAWPLPHEGYRLDADAGRVTFVLHAQGQLIVADNSGGSQVYDSRQLGPIREVSVAGEFNQWNGRQPGYQLTPRTDGTFTLTVDRRQLSQPGQPARFKFQLNHRHWVEAPFATANRTIDPEGRFSLFVP